MNLSKMDQTINSYTKRLILNIKDIFLDQWCLIVRNLSSLHDQNSQLVKFGTNFLSSVLKNLLNDDFKDSIKEKNSFP